MDEVKRAFQRVKQDIAFLTHEIEYLKISLAELNLSMSELKKEVTILKNSIQTPFYNPNLPQKIPQNDPAHNAQFQTHITHSPAHNAQFPPFKVQNLSISTGNEGVPTDRQTDRQTDNTPQNEVKIDDLGPLPTQQKTQRFLEKTPQQKEDSIDNAAKILDSLDSIKKEIRLKFKRLTEQEMVIFSTIYQLDEEQGSSNYQELSKKLHLTESSIRDYVQRMILKGIPIKKNKVNNKKILLSISSDLKKIATLPTILKLREL